MAVRNEDFFVIKITQRNLKPVAFDATFLSSQGQVY